ncbi:type II toxin-antitoxin system antitoxin DNA ADP-ribosyl glycohydrolase DarG [Ectopseudomonas hydrolytica]|uniref:type II toxin-antitoxin system antitoxin DNA ADP-ribosyl glycohydrolase DarG n=1 Tax=Ectopseudomonas hydrolytica TaxID=2493633 RepID=UPI0018A76B2D|nr:macro domain-containing protein [Pseudomonas hydrolytica]MBF8164145.1 macro domain-containing protein [Pseudomonas mendocina]UTH33009.1 macro domain-containing protein [Pseudomonas hydrolytica]UZZ12234.1 macro domain-containing protein [Pseudomonas mendocina]
MIHLTSGNILEASSEAIVNTVNCEGYMGKGIAYQFKLEYPKNFESYALACKKGELRPGTLHVFTEDGKLIVNFPTKDKWRAKSRYEFISDGLKTLRSEILERSIKSIAIPPLGCGNGGLDWAKVKELIFSELSELDNVDINLYEPSKSYKSQPKKEPSLSLSHYLVMEIKPHLRVFSRFRLQKTAFLIDYLNNSDYFKFEAHHYGPYSHSLDIVTKDISEYQSYHKSETSDAKKILEKKLQSDNFYRSVKNQEQLILNASNLVNKIEDNQDLELLTTILFVIHKNSATTKKEIISTIAKWSDRKNRLFSEQDIIESIKKLETLNMIKIDFLNNITKSHSA